MKKNALFVLFLCISLTLTAEDGYRKMLVNGRTWNMMNVYINDVGNEEKPDTFRYSVTIDGPYEFDGKLCYKYSHQSQEEATTFLYEEGHKVYSCRRDLMTGEYDEWREEYNFDLKVGEEGVYSIDTICVNGEYYRRLSFGWDTWVDGIGSSITGIYSPKWTIIPGNLSVMEVLSVYDGDECIFTKADFKQPVVTGIQVMKTLPKFDNLIYDLQGRRIQPEALHKGIYIQNGKKFVVE